MDRFQELKVFVAVAEEEGFAAGARRLQMSPPPVTRAISSLEKRLGVKLLNRTTRYVRVTDAGQRYLENARRILSDLEIADEAAVGINATPRGVLSITTPVLFGRIHIVPGVVDYLQRYPDTQVSVALLDRVVNLLEEGFDAGIRIGELPDSSMHAVRVATVRPVICASPEYLEANGIPTHPEQLSDHPIISRSESIGIVQWRFEQKGKPIQVRLKPRLSVSNGDALLSATLLGYGFGEFLSYQVEQPVAEGKLKIVLKDFELPGFPVHIIHREGREVSAKLRGFIDVMVERLKATTFT